MAYMLNGTNQYISVNSAPASGIPLTLSALVYPSFNDVQYPIIDVTDSFGATTGSRVTMFFNGGAAGDPVQCLACNTNTCGSAITTSGFSINTWNSGISVSTQNNRSSFINASGKGTNESTINLAILTSMRLATRIVDGSVDSYLNGRLAECAIWNVALTDAEIASLAKGFKPTRIRPQSLVFYAPLLRNLQDLKGGLALTNNNGATVADHPRVY